jgi:glucosamine--fructose-6-phosphate aminotransferase (isomerizing)
MCGIVGYIGEKEALPILLGSLERVTYRGYDSYGVAVLNGKQIEVFKRVGAVDTARETIPFKGTIGIGHTRWATVGGVSEQNAHPHLDCTKQIALVHNGDIDNYRQLRDSLIRTGHTFESETDTEVIAHLIETHMRLGRSLVEAVDAATKQLEGSYALVVMEHKTRRLAVARRDSPVVIGLGDREVFVASDAPAIIPYTHTVIYPEDGDVALVTTAGIDIWHAGSRVERSVRTIDWDASRIEKGGYDHFMLKEIHEQPHTIRDTINHYAAGLPDLPVDKPDHVQLIGCGTSLHACMVAEQFLGGTDRFGAASMVASELMVAPFKAERGLAVAVSQSGETADTISAIKRLVDSGYKTLAITNVRHSSIARLADQAIYTSAGPEVAVAATKTFTAQIVALAMLSAKLLDGTERAAVLRRELRALPVRIEQTLERSYDLEEAGAAISAFDHMFIVGKGQTRAVTLEAALKFKEVAYLHAEGVPAGELKHGPFALLDEKTPVLAFVADDEHKVRMITALREIKARKAPIFILTDGPKSELDELASHIVELPKVGAGLGAAVFTVASQLLAYYCGRARGCEIDRPRNLAKSVTVP